MNNKNCYHLFYTDGKRRESRYKHILVLLLMKMQFNTAADHGEPKSFS